MNKINNYYVNISLWKKQNPNASGIKLANKLNSFPDSRCKFISDCLSVITPGSRNVYVHVKYFFSFAC